MRGSFFLISNPILKKGILSQAWLTIAKSFWKKIRQCISQFHHYLSSEICKALNLKDFKFPFTKGCSVPRLVIIVQGVFYKKIFKPRQCSFAISFTLDKSRGPSLRNLKSVSWTDFLGQIWFKLEQSFSF